MTLVQLQQNYSRVCPVRYVSRHTAGITGTGHFGKFGTTSIPVPPVPVQTFIPVPDTLVSSVEHQYRYRRHFGKFGTTSISVPGTLGKFGTTSNTGGTNTGTSGTAMDVCLYPSWYRYRYSIDTGTGRFPDASLNSVRHQPGTATL